MPRLSAQDRANLIVDLATSNRSQADLAIQYGISKSAVTQFKAQNGQKIEELINKHLEKITGDNVKNQEWRLKEYEKDLAKLDGRRSPEFVRVRGQLLHQIAEEMGQLPPRMQIQIMPVTHIVRGIDLDEALPILDGDSYDSSQMPLRASVSKSESLKELTGTTRTPDDSEALELLTEP